MPCEPWGLHHTVSSVPILPSLRMSRHLVAAGIPTSLGWARSPTSPISFEILSRITSWAPARGRPRRLPAANFLSLSTRRSARGSAWQEVHRRIPKVVRSFLQFRSKPVRISLHCGLGWMAMLGVKTRTEHLGERPRTTHALMWQLWPPPFHLLCLSPAAEPTKAPWQQHAGITRWPLSSSDLRAQRKRGQHGVLLCLIVDTKCPGSRVELKPRSSHSSPPSLKQTPRAVSAAHG